MLQVIRHDPVVPAQLLAEVVYGFHLPAVFLAARVGADVFVAVTPSVEEGMAAVAVRCDRLDVQPKMRDDLCDLGDVGLAKAVAPLEDEASAVVDEDENRYLLPRNAPFPLLVGLPAGLVELVDVDMSSQDDAILYAVDGFRGRRKTGLLPPVDMLFHGGGSGPQEASLPNHHVLEQGRLPKSTSPFGTGEDSAIRNAIAENLSTLVQKNDVTISTYSYTFCFIDKNHYCFPPEFAGHTWYVPH